MLLKVFLYLNDAHNSRNVELGQLPNICIRNKIRFKNYEYLKFNFLESTDFEKTWTPFITFKKFDDFSLWSFLNTV